MAWLEYLGNVIWNPWLLGLFLFTGIYLTIRTKAIQLTAFPLWWHITVGSLFHKKEHIPSNSGISQTQALATALASTIGTGSVVGVATAIYFGGAGAVFWMWISALFGMATSCIEKILSIHYRTEDKNGIPHGGPMYYIIHGLQCPFLASIFSCFCLLASLCGGNMVQANSIATALSSGFHLSPLVVGVVVAVVTGIIICGGITSIGKVSERMVPCMALLFLIGGIFVLFHHRKNIPSAFLQITSSAYSFNAIAGGGIGYTVGQGMRYGIARGVFTNEAGMGSSAIAHGASQVTHPAEEGMWGIFEVFLSTMVVCTITALTILCSGVYCAETALSAISQGQVSSSLIGAPMTMAAFETALGPLGRYLVGICLVLFAFTSLLGWNYYGVCSLTYLVGHEKFTLYYNMCYIVMIVIGSVSDVSGVWLLADILNGLMALPNLIALLLLAPKGIQLLQDWVNQPSI